MKLVHLYLVGYFVLLLGAVLALWQAGILQRLSGIWLFIFALIAVGLGIVLAASSISTTTITKE